MKIIFAQGNPGQQYTNSRHNVGFAMLDNLAESSNTKWTEKPKFQAFVSELIISDKKTMLIKPTSFYNETGASARKILDFYKIDNPDDMLVIHDDLDLTFGTIRVRKQGSDAGNMGIKSLKKHLDSSFMRIRIGTNNELRQKGDEASFVLGKFSADESVILKNKIIPKVHEIIYEFCAEKITETSYKV